MNKVNKVFCLYHGPGCFDGLAAAWVVYDYYKETRVLGETFIALPVAYGEDFEQRFKPEDFADSLVYVVDFSLPPDVLLRLTAQSRLVFLFDHHKTAIAQWKDVTLPLGRTAIFDVTRSGTRITWDHFHPNEDPPIALILIEDRDLWKFKYEMTKEHHAFLKCKSWVGGSDFFVRMSEHVRNLDDSNEYQALVRAHGSVAIKARDALIQEILATSTSEEYICGQLVPVAAIPKALHSEAAVFLQKLYPNAPFTVTYSDLRGKGRREYSFRSKAGSGVDVSTIAAALGGGGHPTASGVSVPLTPSVGDDVMSNIRSTLQK